MADPTNPPTDDKEKKGKGLASYLKGLVFRTNKQVEVLDEQNKPVMVGGKWVNRSIGHIKQDMLNQLRSLSDGAPPRLRERTQRSRLQ